MTIEQRADAYRLAFPQYPGSWPWLTAEAGHAVIYAVWVLGNDYRARSPLYGAYPPSYLARAKSLFPDALEVLHAFSGSLPYGCYHRLDSVNRTGDTRLDRFTQGSVYDAAALYAHHGPFDLVMADPPYTEADAKRYGTPTVDRRRAMAALAAVTKPGGYLAWLDACWPMHAKRQWVTVGRIYVQRSTNHRTRVLTLFERAA